MSMARIPTFFFSESIANLSITFSDLTNPVIRRTDAIYSSSALFSSASRLLPLKGEVSVVSESSAKAEGETSLKASSSSSPLYTTEAIRIYYFLSTHQNLEYYSYAISSQVSRMYNYLIF